MTTSHRQPAEVLLAQGRVRPETAGSNDHRVGHEAVLGAARSGPTEIWDDDPGCGRGEVGRMAIAADSAYSLCRLLGRSAPARPSPRRS